jgi:HK97 gp10 family phage protein
MKFKITGLKELQRELTKMETDIPKQVEAELKGIADGILADAVARVPVDKGLLRGSAFVEKIDGGWTIGFSAKYSPYQEFGSGPFTEVPTGYEDFAREFYIDGTGKTKPQPFLFPAFLAKRDGIVDELEQALRGYLKGK